MAARRKRPAKPAPIDDLLEACFERGQAFFLGDLSGVHVGMLRAFDGNDAPARFVAVQPLPNEPNPPECEVFADLRKYDAVCFGVLRAPNGVHVRARLAGMLVVREMREGETLIDTYLAMVTPNEGSTPFRVPLGTHAGLEIKDGVARIAGMGGAGKGAVSIPLPKRADVEETLKRGAVSVLGRIFG